MTEVQHISARTPQATGRIPAFVGLARYTGGVFVQDEDNPMTVNEGLAKVGLNFEVKVHDTPVQPVLTEHGVTSVEFPTFRSTVRHNPDGTFGPMGIVKSRFVAVQNHEAAHVGQAIVDEFGANLVAVGAYGNPIGVKTYMALSLPEGMTVGGTDRYDLYLNIVNSHDGSGGLTMTLNVIRFACTNETAANFGKRNPYRFVIRHTKSAHGRIEQARKALQLVPAYCERLDAEFEKMLGTPLTVDGFDEIIAANFAEPTGTTVRSTNAFHARRDSLMHLFREADTNEFGRGTAYAGYQSVVEYLDHVAPVRGGDQSRYTRVVDGQTALHKERLFNAFAAV